MAFRSHSDTSPYLSPLELLQEMPALPRFRGSLPAFLAAFTTRKKLSKAEIDEIRQMIDSFEEE